jgi:hypothetical protein
MYTQRRKKRFFFFIFSPLLLVIQEEEEEERCFSEPLSQPKKKAEINNKFNEILNEAIFIEFSRVFNILVQC